ncbi:MAG: glycosyltransferase [Nonlabens sp.]
MELILVIPIIYLFLLLGLALEAQSMKALPVDEIITDQKKGFTVIINFRNESKNLPRLLFSIADLDYDFQSVQFLFVNDGSSDNSVEIIKQFQLKNENLNFEILDRKPRSASAKKDGITQAIQHAKYDHIVTTDADCLLPEKWLGCFESHFKRFPETTFIAAPVIMGSNKSLVQTLQSQEMIALQIMTMGAFQIKRPFMCNGANMGFTVDAFKKVDGYSGNTHISSGDDVFLLEKMWQLDSEHCHYLKNADATVTTFAKETWSDMISQRARWAQKGAETASLLNKAVSFQVLSMSLLFLTAPFLLLFGLISMELFLAIYLLKLCTDFIVLFVGKRFFENRKWLRYFAIQFLIYPVVVIAVTIKSFFKTDWNGREINQPQVEQKT